MGITQAEVKLRRLLAAAPQQKNQAKLMHYVASMREQLGLLTGGVGGEGVNQEIPQIPSAQADEYAKSIDEVADKIDPTTTPDVWESLLSSKDEVAIKSEPVVNNFVMDEPVLAPATLSPTLRRRRMQREAEEGKKIEGLKLDALANETISKHRQIQESLTDEMALLSEQMKNNSYIMEKTLRDTAHYLDDTEEAVEHNLAATNRANERASIIYKSNWKTSCFTWLMLLLMIFIFIFMVGLIRITG